jgi:peptide/nickel transport system permease protein
MIPTLFGITVITFCLLRLAPGDAAAFRVGAEADAGARAEELIATFRRQHLLDQPLWKQYLHYLGPFHLGEEGHTWLGGSGDEPWNGLLVGDLGHEFLRPSVSVADEVWTRLGVTIPLALISVLLSYLLAIPLGVYAAVRRGSMLESTSTAVLFLLYAVPVFWAGLMLQLLFGATGLDWLPAIGLADKDAADLPAFARLVDTGRHAILPIVCLTYGGLAYLSRQMRVGVVETIRADYIRTARAKGLSEARVVWVHALRNALIPVLTLLGQVLPVLVGGAILVETVFDIPGMGRYAYEGLANREYNVVMGTVLVSALMTLVGFLVSDVLYAWADPRIRHG